MKKLRKAEDWFKIFEEAVNAPISQRQWCREHDISIGVYFEMKRRYRKKGILPELRKPAQFILEDACRLDYPNQGTGKILHLYRPPAPCLGKDTLLAVIGNVMKMDAYSGDDYLFLSPDRKTVCMLRWTGVGFLFTKSHKENGSIKWPETDRFFSEQMMESILQML